MHKVTIKVWKKDTAPPATPWVVQCDTCDRYGPISYHTTQLKAEEGAEIHLQEEHGNTGEIETDKGIDYYWSKARDFFSSPIPPIRVDVWHRYYDMGIDPDSIPEIPRLLPKRELTLLQMNMGIRDTTGRVCNDTLRLWMERVNEGEFRHLILEYGERIEVKFLKSILSYEDPHRPGVFRARAMGHDIRLNLGKDYSATPELHISLRDRSPAALLVEYDDRSVAIDDFVSLATDAPFDRKEEFSSLLDYARAIYEYAGRGEASSRVRKNFRLWMDRFPTRFLVEGDRLVCEGWHKDYGPERLERIGFPRKWISFIEGVQG